LREWGWIAGVVAAALLWAAPAEADGVGLEAFALGGRLDLHQTTLSRTSADPPELDALEISLERDGYAVGGGLRLEYMVSRFRFGLDAASWQARDVDVTAAGVPEGHQLLLSDPVGLRGALYVGYEIFDGPVYPYLDLRGGPSALLMAARLYDAAGAEVMSAVFADVTAGFGPRAGLRVPIVEWALVDLAGYYPIVGGHENLTVSLGIALWSGSNDERSK
jgi:hypothetical protein